MAALLPGHSNKHYYVRVQLLGGGRPSGRSRPQAAQITGGHRVGGDTSLDRLWNVRNVSTSFFTYSGEVKAVRNVSFHVDTGEAIALVGESGCGKSVTALSIMQLVAPPGRS